MSTVDFTSNTYLKEIGEKKLVGFRVLCNSVEEYKEEIPKAMKALDSRKNEIGHLLEPVKLIGAFKSKETSEEDDGYWVGFDVHEFQTIPDGMVSLIVPAQRYAVLNFNGHGSEIYQSYGDLHKWISKNGYERSPSDWTLEVYSKWSESEAAAELCDPIL